MCSVSTERTGWRWISLEHPQNWYLPYIEPESIQSKEAGSLAQAHELYESDLPKISTVAEMGKL